MEQDHFGDHFNSFIIIRNKLGYKQWLQWIRVNANKKIYVESRKKKIYTKINSFLILMLRKPYYYDLLMFLILHRWEKFRDVLESFHLDIIAKKIS